MTRYVVTRRNWRPAGGRWVRLPGETFVAGFGTGSDADHARDRGEAAVRSRLGNPFAAAERVGELTTLPEFALADWFQDRGLSPPSARADGTRNWLAWWADRRKFWTDAQVAAVWAALDTLRFFDITARPTDRSVAVAVHLLWEYVPDPYLAGMVTDVVDGVPHSPPPGVYPGYDGGRPERAFRDPADAAAYRALAGEEKGYRPLSPERATERQHLPGGAGVYWAKPAWYDPGDTALDWTAPVEAQFTEVPPCELHEVEYDPTGGPPGTTAYLVYRTGWGPIRWESGRHWYAVPDVAAGGWAEPDRRVPVVVCAAPEVARSRARELEDRDRGVFNPSRFGGDTETESDWVLTPRLFQREWRTRVADLGRRLAALGVVPAGESEGFANPAPADLLHWWGAHAPGWPADVRSAAWDAAGGTSLYGVMPIPFEG